MGWENRGGKRYYYRKKRIGRKVSSEYLGADRSVIQAIENKFTQLKQTNVSDPLDPMADLDTLFRSAHKDLRVIEQWLDFIYSSVMMVSGYHQHHYQWRKKRCRYQKT